MKRETGGVRAEKFKTVQTHTGSFSLTYLLSPFLVHFLITLSTLELRTGASTV